MHTPADMELQKHNVYIPLIGSEEVDMDMHAEIVDRSPQYRGKDDVARFLVDVGFSNAEDARSAVSYYSGLFSGMPMNVMGGSESVYVKRPEEFMSALTGWYKLSQPNARKMMAYLERAVKGKEDPHNVVHELGRINKYILV